MISKFIQRYSIVNIFINMFYTCSNRVRILFALYSFTRSAKVRKASPDNRFTDSTLSNCSRVCIYKILWAKAISGGRFPSIAYRVAKVIAIIPRFLIPGGPLLA